jgi:hypothetical protein
MKGGFCTIAAICRCWSSVGAGFGFGFVGDDTREKGRERERAMVGSEDWLANYIVAGLLEHTFVLRRVGSDRCFAFGRAGLRVGWMGCPTYRACEIGKIP